MYSIHKPDSIHIYIHYTVIHKPDSIYTYIQLYTYQELVLEKMQQTEHQQLFLHKLLYQSYAQQIQTNLKQNKICIKFIVKQGQNLF